MGFGPISDIEFCRSGQPDRWHRLIERRQHERGRQLMTYSIAAPAGPVGRRLVGQRLAAITGTAILTVAFAVAMSTLASAQTPAPAPAAPAAPKPAPAKKPAKP